MTDNVRHPALPLCNISTLTGVLAIPPRIAKLMRIQMWARLLQTEYNYFVYGPPRGVECPHLPQPAHEELKGLIRENAWLQRDFGVYLGGYSLPDAFDWEAAWRRGEYDRRGGSYLTDSEIAWGGMTPIFGHGPYSSRRPTIGMLRPAPSVATDESIRAWFERYRRAERRAEGEETDSDVDMTDAEAVEGDEEDEEGYEGENELDADDEVDDDLEQNGTHAEAQAEERDNDYEDESMDWEGEGDDSEDEESEPEDSSEYAPSERLPATVSVPSLRPRRPRLTSAEEQGTRPGRPDVLAEWQGTEEQNTQTGDTERPQSAPRLPSPALPIQNGADARPSLLPSMRVNRMCAPSAVEALRRRQQARKSAVLVEDTYDDAGFVIEHDSASERDYSVHEAEPHEWYSEHPHRLQPLRNAHRNLPPDTIVEGPVPAITMAGRMTDNQHHERAEAAIGLITTRQCAPPAAIPMRSDRAGHGSVTTNPNAFEDSEWSTWCDTEYTSGSEDYLDGPRTLIKPPGIHRNETVNALERMGCFSVPAPVNGIATAANIENQWWRSLRMLFADANDSAHFNRFRVECWIRDVALATSPASAVQKAEAVRKIKQRIEDIWRDKARLERQAAAQGENAEDDAREGQAYAVVRQYNYDQVEALTRTFEAPLEGEWLGDGSSTSSGTGTTVDLDERLWTAEDLANLDVVVDLDAYRNADELGVEPTTTQEEPERYKEMEEAEQPAARIHTAENATTLATNFYSALEGSEVDDDEVL